MQKVTQAVILAGGQGKRLRPLTDSMPKAMIPIHNKPFVQYIVERLKENGITEIIFLTGYMHAKIEDYFGDGAKFGISITYIYNPDSFESGSRLLSAKKYLNDEFLLLYCDNFWPLQLNNLLSFSRKMKTLATVVVYRNNDNYSSNNILVNSNGMAQVYEKKSNSKGLNGVDIGFFIMQKDVLNLMPVNNFSFELIIKLLVAKNELAGYMTNHKYYGLSTKDRIPDISDFFRPTKICILDRDGVINTKPAKGTYITSVTDFKLLTGALEGLSLLSKNGYEIYIITNQAGIKRGLMSEKDLERIHAAFLSDCRNHKIIIKQIYYCPHGWHDDCDCRKPKPGMFYQAAAEYHFDLTKAIYIGDDPRDVLAGKNAGCRNILMKPNGNLLHTIKKFLI